MKAIEQYFHVVWFIMLYKVFLALQSVHEILKRKHLKHWNNKRNWEVLFCGVVYYAVQRCYNLF